MKVKDIMYTRLFTIAHNATVEEAAKMMDENNIGSLLVQQDTKHVGIVTEWDVVRKVVAAEKKPQEITVSEIKSYPLIIVDSEFDIIEAAKLMQTHDIRRLMVVEKGKIVGVISTNTISNHLQKLISK